MLKFVPDHHKTKRICKHGVNKLPYPLRYDPDLNKCVTKLFYKMVEL